MLLTAQWGAAEWGAAPWGGESDSSSSAVVLGPSGIASGATIPSPVVHATIGLAGIGTHFAAGTPFVNVLSRLSLTGISTRIAIGIANVAGPITVGGIASHFAAGLTFINQVQTVGLTAGIASALAFGVATVRHVQTVSPSGIATHFAAGTARIVGTPRRIFAIGIAPGLAGVPRLVGGKPGIKIFIGGVNRTSYLKVQTANVESQTIGRSTAKFDLFAPVLGYFPEVGQTVIIMDSGQKIFAGCMNEIVDDRPLSTNSVIIHCSAVDKAGICDHRVCNTTYKAGMDVCDAVRDLVSNFLNGEGITTQGVPASLAQLTSDVPLNFTTVTQGLDRLATDTGSIWWVDFNGVLHFDRIVNLGSAPFSLSETSKNWSALTVTRTLANYRNRQYVVSNLTVGTAGSGGGPAPGALGAAIVETYVLPQADAASRGFVLGSIVLKFPARQIAQLKVNGVVQPVLNGITDAQYSFEHAWWTFPDSPYLYPPNAGNANPFPDPPDPSPDPAPGDTVEISYVPVNQNASQNSSDPLTTSSGTCGSGIYENVQQVKNIASSTSLAAIAAALLARFNTVPIILKFQTDFPGLAVGQIIHVDLPKNEIPNQDLLITGVSAVSVGVDMERGTGGSFRYTVSCAYPQDQGNWLKWFENFVATATSQPDPSSGGGPKAPPAPAASAQFQETTFVLAPGGSLANGVVDSNRQIVNETGALFECLIDFAHPPIDADLEIDVFDLDTGFSIFGGNVPKFLDASTDLLVHTAFANGEASDFSTMLYAKSRLFVVVTYLPKAATFTAASNGTVRLRTR